MKITTTAQLLVLPLGLGAAIYSAQLAIATNPTSPGVSISATTPPSGGHVGGQIKPGGGHYEGPGDTVPPCDGCSTPPSQCSMPLGYVCGGPECDDLSWQPDYLVCKYPQFGNSSTPVWTQGYALTLGNVIETLQNSTACFDPYGNITTRIDAPFPVDEVHVFESGWINGYIPAPIDQSVSATVCFDGTPTIVGWSFNQVAFDYDCAPATVSITFNASCMQQALMDWYANGTDMGANWDKWLFYVDFVSCDPCEDDGSDFEIDPWERGVYKGPGDTVPLPE
jgi:hypothetical protein